MSRAIFREVNTMIPTSTGGSQRQAFFSIRYDSNRENGQIVKRESPMVMHKAAYTRWRPSNNLDAGNEYFAGQTQQWQYQSSIAYGRAYSAFKRKAEMPSAEMLLNVVEGRKSLEMIAARAFQIRQIVSNLRKGRLGDAWEFMTMNPNASLKDMTRNPAGRFRFKDQKIREQMILDRKRWRSFVKDVGSVILEVRYGWAPLMQDMKGALDVLSKPLPDKPLKVVKTTQYADRQYAPDVAHYSERVTIKGTIRISNPNLDLANRLGLVNPASVLWEAVPFSFLVDWFLPVGDFLRSFTDFLGLELIDGSVTARLGMSAPIRRGYVIKDKDTSILHGDAYSIVAMKMVRDVLVTLPRPPLLAGSGLSPGRALNAVALLLQGFKSTTARSAYG